MRKRGDFNVLEGFTWYVPGEFDIFLLLAWVLLGAVLGNILTFLLVKLPAPLPMEYIAMIAYPFIFIPAMVYAASKSRRSCLKSAGVKIDSSHFAPVGGWLCALLVVLGTLALSVVSDAFGVLLPAMPEWLETMLKSMTGGNFWINFICVSIMAPFFEEWLCRGMVLRGLLGNGMKPVTAILVSALFFAIIHLNPWQAIPAFLIGCLFGYVYYRTGSLKLTMLMHFANNTMALIAGHSESLGEYDTFVDMLGDKYLPAALLCVVIVGLVVLIFKRIPLASGQGNCDVTGTVFDKSEN